MVDWSSSMRQTFEYYIVDPGTWADLKPLTNIVACTISRDSDAETLGSATIDITESVGECYIRVYLITIQNGVKEKHPLGTFLVQTPASSFNGKVRNVSMDAYTPLLELKESQPEIGRYIPKNENIMDAVYKLANEHARAPVVRALCEEKLYSDFVSETEDTWLSFLSDLMSNAKYKFSLDEMGRILFKPDQDVASLQPVWTYNDDNCSILYPDMSLNHDIYGIPNVVEVIYSKNSEQYYSRVVNDDPNSPISTVNRGREIIHRVTNPDLIGDPTGTETNEQGVTVFGKRVDEYAKQLLRDLSCLEYTISYTHGYCPVRIGDCVRFNYSKAGLNDIKAKVISQSITCKPGCKVSEKAIFTSRLWG